MQTQKKEEVSTKKDFIVKFSGLKSGSYDYDFDLDDDFFLSYGNENLQSGSVKFNVKLIRRERLMTFEFDFSGKVGSFCDRCLKPLDIPVSGHETLYVKFSDNETSEDEDMVVLPENEYQIDLSQQMYEYVAVSLPMRNVHPDDENGNPTCDGEMMKILNNVAVEENQTETENNNEVNPIWEKLKELNIK